MGKKAEVVLAWTLLVGSLIGWPVSALTVAKDEPPVVRDDRAAHWQG